MANEHLAPVWWPHPSLKTYWDSGLHHTEGATQPWVQALLYQLCRALDVRRAVELGCYRGVTSAWLALAIEANGGGRLDLVDTNQTFLTVAMARVGDVNTGTLVATAGHAETSFAFLREHFQPDTQFIFMDDDKADIKQKVHVIRDCGCQALIAVHDVEHNQPQLEGLNAVTLKTPVLHGTGWLALIP
jgi:predicted O-methyltransferase YrrM